MNLGMVSLQFHQLVLSDYYDSLFVPAEMLIEARCGSVGFENTQALPRDSRKHDPD